jgi:hypothetical protein
MRYGGCGGAKAGIGYTTPQVTPMDEPSKQPPTAFVLLEDFPNPFNPSTTIACELPRSTRVNLRVCDILGRVVSVHRNHDAFPQRVDAYDVHGAVAEEAESLVEPGETLVPIQPDIYAADEKTRGHRENRSSSHETTTHSILASSPV